MRSRHLLAPEPMSGELSMLESHSSPVKDGEKRVCVILRAKLIRREQGIRLIGSSSQSCTCTLIARAGLRTSGV